MDDRKLRLFLAIVEEGSVTAAAARLHLAQPSVSQTLRAIEREYGVELFHRMGRGLRITPAGEALVGPAREALGTLEAVGHAVEQITDLAVGHLHLAALSTLASDPLAELVGAFRLSHPGIVIRVFEPEGVAALGALVRDGSCELGLAHLPLATRGLVVVPLGQQDLLFVLPPHSPGGAGPLRPKALANLPLVVAPAGTSTRTLLEQVLADAGVEPLIAVETAAREATIPLVLAGAGAALLPSSLAAEAGRRGAIVRVPEPRIRRRIGLIHRQGRLSPAASAFLRDAVAMRSERGTRRGGSRTR
jgi:DNA-binding transcriptional LysR family regulator